MANNYCQWSEYLSLNSEAESAWMKSVLYFEAGDYDTPDNLTDTQKVVRLLKQEFDITLDEDNADFFPGFCKEFDDDGRGVCLYAEEYGNVEVAATIVQAFLKKFRPDDYFKIEWADTCSKPRVGEFGGGAVFVTANKIEYMHTGSWIDERRKAFGK